MRRFQLLDILVEFKYVPLSKVGMDGQTIKVQTVDTLHALQPVQAKLSEAKTQVQGYRTKLAAKYGDQLRLRTYVVVAIGFERVVWQEIN